MNKVKRNRKLEERRIREINNSLKYLSKSIQKESGIR